MDIALKQLLVEILEKVEKQHVGAKEILSLQEAAAYINRSKSFLYKLTFTRKIPYYLPAGKVIYFKRLELDEWITKNRMDSKEEIENSILTNRKK